MLVIGLTGGVGSGKSTVARLFADKGVPVIDADLIARQLTMPGKPALQAIAKHFGVHVLLKDGSLNRPALREIIFNTPSKRLWLEQLLHPLIREMIAKELATISASELHPPYCIVVIPLLLETKSYPFIDRILVVDAPESLQIERVSARDNTQATSAKAIINTQMHREERLKQANDVIINKGSLADLPPQVEQLHEQYSKKVMH